MEHVTIKGLVLRETDFGDADRFLTVLTEDGARIEVLCRGIRRRNGRLSAAVGLFCWSEMTLYQARGKFTLNSASLVTSFWGLTADLERYALACYLAELTIHLTDADEPLEPACPLLLYALHALAGQGRDAALVKAAFELRLLAESGYWPDLDSCAACGSAIGDEVWFSPTDGVARCASCAGRLGGEYVRLLPGTRAAMVHILTREPRRLYAFALGEPARGQLAAVCEAYALRFAERSFDSLKLYHSLLPRAAAAGERKS